MSMQVKSAAHCPSCNAHVDLLVYRTIEVDKPKERELVAGDKINTFKCPKCGFGPVRLGSSLLALAPSKHVAVWFEPKHDPYVDQEQRGFAAQLGADSFFAQAPRIADWDAFKRKIEELEAHWAANPPTPEQEAALEARARKLVDKP